MRERICIKCGEASEIGRLYCKSCAEEIMDKEIFRAKEELEKENRNSRESFKAKCMGILRK